MLNIDIIVGARPNFMKIAPIIHEIKKRQNNSVEIDFRLIHTGQHYDKNMSQTFFDDLNIPMPNVNFGIGSGSQGYQAGNIMIEYEKIINNQRPHIVIVVGDVTSTMACTIVAKKEGIKVAHVEGGIRSFDLKMPEEINRMVTDSISDYFFTTSKVANENLRKSGIEDNRILFVGNTMIDTLLKNESKFRKPSLWDEFKLNPKTYIVMTMHRPRNVDNENKLKDFIKAITNVVKEHLIIFPAHPRTASILNKLDIEIDNLKIVPPMGYLEFGYMIKHAEGVITDSGGITEETTVLGIPCITLRDNTERPETVTEGTNMLAGTDPAKITEYLEQLLTNNWKKGKIPALWDGLTSERIVNHLLELNLAE